MNRLLPVSSVALWTCLVVPGAAREKAAPRSREFQFTYAASVTGLKPGQSVRIWVPVPTSNPYQDIQIIAKKLPAQGKVGKETKFGNQILYLEAKADKKGTIPLALTYRVKRREVKGDANSPRLTKQEIERFLLPDARVPVGGKPAETLLKDKKLPEDQMRLARVLYDLVNNHMQYSKKGIGWGQGDAVWACDSRYGNCTDFHSLFLSLARTLKIPGKFEIGFLLPEKRGRAEVGGYHCWAWFHPEDRGWVPVDISEANQARAAHPELVNYCFGNLTEDRVAFSIGRDLTLVPPQAGPPINFLIYPYVEVAGQPYPAERVQRRFSFQDVE